MRFSQGAASSSFARRRSERARAGALDVEASYTAALDPFVKEGRRDAHRDLADRRPVIIDTGLRSADAGDHARHAS